MLTFAPKPIPLNSYERLHPGKGAFTVYVRVLVPQELVVKLGGPEHPLLPFSRHFAEYVSKRTFVGPHELMTAAVRVEGENLSKIDARRLCFGSVFITTGGQSAGQKICPSQPLPFGKGLHTSPDSPPVHTPSPQVLHTKCVGYDELLLDADDGRGGGGGVGIPILDVLELVGNGGGGGTTGDIGGGGVGTPMLDEENTGGGGGGTPILDALEPPLLGGGGGGPGGTKQHRFDGMRQISVDEKVPPRSPQSAELKHVCPAGQSKLEGGGGVVCSA